MNVAKIVAKSVASEPMNLQRRGDRLWTNLRLPQMAGRTLNLPCPRWQERIPARLSFHR